MLPSIEELTTPVFITLQDVIGRSKNGPPLTKAEMHGIAGIAGPGKTDLTQGGGLDLGAEVWLLRLRRVRKALCAHKDYGKYYERYDVDKVFADDTLAMPFYQVAGYYASKVMDAYGSGKSTEDFIV